MSNDHYTMLDRVMCSVRGTGGLFNKGWGNVKVPLDLYNEIQDVRSKVLAGTEILPSIDRVQMEAITTLSNGVKLQDVSLYVLRFRYVALISPSVYFFTLYSIAHHLPLL